MLIERDELTHHIEVQSAGTGDWHVGQRADARTVREARSRGVHITSVAQCFETDDFSRFQYVISVDRSNAAVLRERASSQDDQKKIFLLRSFEPGAPESADVPDPYHGGEQGFSEVFDMCVASCEGLLKYIRNKHEL
jgi:protein-tyrosine phosphatase